MKIAQWKKGDSTNYCSEINTFSAGENFPINGVNCAYIKGDFEEQICYSFKKLNLKNLSSRPINIKLINGNNFSNYQTLKKIQNVSEIDLTDFTFIPKRKFEYIVFECAYGDPIKVNPTSLRKIENIYETIGKPYITSLGIQGVSGLKFVINGNVIQIGKNRVYTVSDVDIDFIGFIIEEKESDDNDKEKQTIPVPLNRTDNYFIMDYQYEDEEV